MRRGGAPVLKEFLGCGFPTGSGILEEPAENYIFPRVTPFLPIRVSECTTFDQLAIRFESRRPEGWVVEVCDHLPGPGDCLSVVKLMRHKWMKTVRNAVFVDQLLNRLGSEARILFGFLNR